MGWLVLVVVGLAFWWWSLALTLRAYPGERVPVWANPVKAPRRAVVLRAVGAAALVFGTGMFSATWDLPGWVAAVAVGGSLALLLFAPYVAVVALRNRRAGAP